MTVTNEPFDRSQPSPIAAVASMLSSASEAVVVAGKLTERQRRVAIQTGIERRILERIQVGGIDLVVISGSAGDGKSYTLGALLEPGNPWEAHPGRVIEDATHSERPEEAQRDRLKRFFAPLRAGEPPLAGPPLIIAMNTGMVIRFFNGLREEPGAFEPYRELAEVLFHALRIPHREPRNLDPGMAERVLVVNLDERPTTGAEGSFFRGALAAFDPAAPDGVMHGAPRCETCTVRSWCWVRSNAEILSADPALSALDSLAGEMALVRGRSISPRALWDAGASLALGGAAFGAEDPCDEIALAAAADDLEKLWEHSLPNGVFHTGRVGGLAAVLRDRDPSYGADAGNHAAIASAGIDSSADAAALLETLGAPGSGKRAVIATLAMALERGLLASVLGEDRARRETGRALARARWLAGAVRGTDPDVELFSEALEQFSAGGGGNAVDELEEMIGDALARTFGESIGGERFFRSGREDARDVAVYVRVDLAPGRSHAILEDPVLETNHAGAEIVGYRPLVLPVQIAGIDVPLTFGLFRVLREASEGRLPSGKELERFYSLGRAVTALGNQAGQDHSQPIVIADRRGAGRRLRIELQQRRGSRRFREQEVL